MKQKVGIVLSSALLIANVGFASPLTDYDQGKVALDITF